MDTEARIRADWAGLVVIRDVIRPVTLSPAFALCIVATCLCSSSALPLPIPCSECVLSTVELSFLLSISLSLSLLFPDTYVSISFLCLSFDYARYAALSSPNVTALLLIVSKIVSC